MPGATSAKLQDDGLRQLHRFKALYDKGGELVGTTRQQPKQLHIVAFEEMQYPIDQQVDRRDGCHAVVHFGEQRVLRQSRSARVGALFRG